MLRHDDLWKAIDDLAAKHRLSASGLARRAGLDPTTFNKSKRTTRDGKRRWPSTESVAKILAATGESLEEFVELIHPEGNRGVQFVPLMSSAMALGRQGLEMPNDDAVPSHQVLPVPSTGDSESLALRITGDRYQPVFRDGDILVLSPSADVSAGQRVAAADGEELIVGELQAISDQDCRIRTLGAEAALVSCRRAELKWLARIVWVSQ